MQQKRIRKHKPITARMCGLLTFDQVRGMVSEYTYAEIADAACVAPVTVGGFAVATGIAVGKSQRGRARHGSCLRGCGIAKGTR
jgi:hypothetical protein